MTEERRARAQTGAENEFVIIRKGYDPAEVDQCLAEYDDAFRELEEYAARLKHELSEARLEIGRLQAAEKESVDNAMLAVFAAKDRIIQEAHERARMIEEKARSSVSGPEPLAAVPEPPAIFDVPTPVAAAGPPLDGLLAELTEAVGEEPVVAGEEPDVVDPNAVLQKMLQEAEEIRNRLDSGLAAAFDQMEQMQRDAEDRAESMLAAARLEAARLRSSADTDDGPIIEVTLPDDLPPRPSRYSRNSAQLPRIGSEDGASVLAKMNSLRARMREDDEDTEPVPTTDATG